MGYRARADLYLFKGFGAVTVPGELEGWALGNILSSVCLPQMSLGHGPRSVVGVMRKQGKLLRLLILTTREML